MGKGPIYAPVAKHPNPSSNCNDALDRLFKTVKENDEKRRKENEDRKLKQLKGKLWYKEDETDSDG
jgi:hypothetical protein